MGTLYFLTSFVVRLKLLSKFSLFLNTVKEVKDEYDSYALVIILGIVEISSLLGNFME